MQPGAAKNKVWEAGPILGRVLVLVWRPVPTSPTSNALFFALVRPVVALVRPLGGRPRLVRPLGGRPSLVRPLGGLVRGVVGLVRPLGGRPSLVRPLGGRPRTQKGQTDPLEAGLGESDLWEVGPGLFCTVLYII